MLLADKNHIAFELYNVDLGNTYTETLNCTLNDIPLILIPLTCYPVNGVKMIQRFIGVNDKGQYCDLVLNRRDNTLKSIHNTLPKKILFRTNETNIDFVVRDELLYRTYLNKGNCVKEFFDYAQTQPFTPLERLLSVKELIKQVKEITVENAVLKLKTESVMTDVFK